MSLRLDVASDDQGRKQRQTIRIVGIVMPFQCRIKSMLLAPPDEQTRRYRNFHYVEDLLGQLVPCRSDSPLNRANKQGQYMLVRLGTSRCSSQIASLFGRRLVECCKNRFMDYNNLIVLQFFGLVLGVAVLIMRSAEFEPDENVASNWFHLRLTSTSSANWT